MIVKIDVSVSQVNIGIPEHLNEVRAKRFWTFAATEWHRLYEPYVPYHEGILANTVTIIGGRGNGEIHHTAPYARYQYHGKAYGPSYPIMQNGVIVGYSRFAANYVQFGNYQLRRTTDGGLAFKITDI